MVLPVWERKGMKRVLVAAALAAGLAARWVGARGQEAGQPQAVGPTLSARKRRDVLTCGVSTGTAGFILPDSRDE